MQQRENRSQNLLRCFLFAGAALAASIPVIASHPYIGHDYVYVLPRLVDTYYFLRTEGLAVQWWTPSFAGGLPAFGNPQSMQFSLPQLFTFVLNPILAVFATAALVTVLAAVALHRVARRVWQWNEHAALALALSGSTTGFFIERLSTGHLCFHGFALVPLLVLFASDETIPTIIAVAGFAVTTAYFIYSGGYFIATMAPLALAMMLGITFVIGPRGGPKRVVHVVAGGSVLGLALASAKLVAVLSFLSQFPREIASEPVEHVASLALPLAYFPAWVFARALHLGPADPDDFAQSILPYPYRIWELDHSLSLVTLLGSLVFVAWAARRLSRLDRSQRVACLVTFGVAALVVTLAAAKGTVFAALKQLPVLRSQHVNIRFISALALPLCALGAAAFQYPTRSLSTRARKGLALAALALFVVQLVGYERVLHRPNFGRAYQVGKLYRTFEADKHRLPLPPVSSLAEEADDNAVMRYESSLLPYEPLFGYDRQEFLARHSLREGDARAVRDGRFNMNFPPAIAYPGYAGMRPFDRIPVSDGENFERFVSRRQPTWALPPLQRAANAVTLVALAALVGAIAGQGIKRRRTPLVERIEEIANVQATDKTA